MSASKSRPATAVIVTIEGLGTNLIGAYGNAIAPTPHLDRFASHGVVCDQFWMDGCVPEQILASMFQGSHRASRLGRPDPQTDLGTAPRSLRSIQAPGLFVSDSPDAVALAQTHLDGESLLASSAPESSSALSSLVEQSIEQWLPVMDTMPWLWIHSRGLLGTWDAPYAYRCAMCDEGDPMPPEGTAPPVALVDKNTDPDTLFGWACGAGAQAMLLDEVWEWMETALDHLDIAPSCLLTLAGVLGYPLGEHGLVGWPSQLEQVDAPKSKQAQIDSWRRSHLHAESLHTPWMIRPGNQLPLGVRLAPFLQPHHLGLVVDSWIERDGWVEAKPGGRCSESRLGVEDLVPMSSLRREAWPALVRGALATYGSSSALLVPSWGAIWRGDENDEADMGLLYAMPDDRWQQNEVGSRATEVLEQMRHLRDAWIEDSSQMQSNLQSTLSRMDMSLWRPQR